MFRLSVTTIDYFARVNWEDAEKAAEFITSITHPPPPTEAMLLGTAFHYFLQNNVPPPFCYEEGGVAIELQAPLVHAAREIFYETLHKKRICAINKTPAWEVKRFIVKNFKTGSVEIVGVADGIANGIIEIKTTKYYKYENYADSLQWAFYLDIFDMPYIDYFVFELSSDSQTLKQMHNFRFYRHGVKMDRIFLVVEDFLDFIVENNLERYFIKT